MKSLGNCLPISRGLSFLERFSPSLPLFPPLFHILPLIDSLSFSCYLLERENPSGLRTKINEDKKRNREEKKTKRRIISKKQGNGKQTRSPRAGDADSLFCTYIERCDRSIFRRNDYFLSPALQNWSAPRNDRRTARRGGASQGNPCARTAPRVRPEFSIFRVSF